MIHHELSTPERARVLESEHSDRTFHYFNSPSSNQRGSTNNNHTREQMFMPLFVLTQSTKYITAPPTGTEETQYCKESPVLAAALSGLDYLITFKGGSKQRGVP